MIVVNSWLYFSVQHDHAKKRQRVHVGGGAWRRKKRSPIVYHYNAGKKYTDGKGLKPSYGSSILFKLILFFYFLYNFYFFSNIFLCIFFYNIFFMSPYFNILDGGGSRFKDANIVLYIIRNAASFPPGSLFFSLFLIKGRETTAEMLN